MFAAGVGGVDGFAIVQVVLGIDSIDEDHARFRIGIGGAHDGVPQIPGRQAFVGNPFEFQLPGGVFGDRLHESVGDQHRQIEHPEPPRFALGLDKGLDIRVVAPHHPHHGATPRPGAHDGAAHGVPDIHEAQRPGRIGADAVHRRALGPERRKIVADAAALLHGQGGFFQVFENAGHVVGDIAHDETVEQRHPSVRPGAGENTAGRQKIEILHDLGETLLPKRLVVFGRGQGTGDAPEAVGHGFIDRVAVGPLEAVFHVPDLAGYLGGLRHLDFQKTVLTRALMWPDFDPETAPVLANSSCYVAPDLSRKGHLISAFYNMAENGLCP